jgi:hypothetical protein
MNVFLNRVREKVTASEEALPAVYQKIHKGSGDAAGSWFFRTQIIM